MTVSSVNCRFPKDVAVRQQWLREIRREKFTPSGTSVICSDHFEESCYVATAELRRKLQTGTVPTIFKLPEHLIKVPNERKHPKQINEIDKNGSQLSINNDPSTSYSCLSPSKETSQRLQDEHSYSNRDSPVQLKRRLDDSLATHSTSSSCQSPSKETSQRIQDEHSYSNMDSPVKLKRRLDDTLASMEDMREKMKYQRQKNQRLGKKVKYVQSIVVSLRKDNKTSLPVCSWRS